jgi:hypothetical protein
MGFVDKVKKATGLGLSAAEHYDRAFEKGVLLGPASFAAASVLFDAAARKAREAKDELLCCRAHANARLYAFLSTGHAGELRALGEALVSVGALEPIGSRAELLPASALSREIDGRLIEADLSVLAEEDHAARAELHRRAGQVFAEHPGGDLVTYRFQGALPHAPSADARRHFHLGMAAWHRAHAAFADNPETAAEHMGVSLSAFRQCRDDEHAERAQAWLLRLRQKRTCWMCHREFQGADVHFRAYSASITPYVASRVEAHGEDTSALSQTDGHVILCRPCGSAVEAQADRFATLRMRELEASLGRQIDALKETVDELTERVAHLEGTSRRT